MLLKSPNSLAHTDIYTCFLHSIIHPAAQAGFNLCNFTLCQWYYKAACHNVTPWLCRWTAEMMGILQQATSRAMKPVTVLVWLIMLWLYLYHHTTDSSMYTISKLNFCSTVNIFGQNNDKGGGSISHFQVATISKLNYCSTILFLHTNNDKDRMK